MKISPLLWLEPGTAAGNIDLIFGDNGYYDIAVKINEMAYKAGVRTPAQMRAFGRAYKSNKFRMITEGLARHYEGAPSLNVNLAFYQALPKKQRVRISKLRRIVGADMYNSAVSMFGQALGVVKDVAAGALELRVFEEMRKRANKGGNIDRLRRVNSPILDFLFNGGNIEEADFSVLEDLYNEILEDLLGEELVKGLKVVKDLEELRRRQNSLKKYHKKAVKAGNIEVAADLAEDIADIAADIVKLAALVIK